MLEVWDSAGHHINEDVLVRHIEVLRLQREPDGAPLSRDEIVADINFAVSNRYLNRYERDLRADQRLRFEIDYTGHLRHQEYNAALVPTATGAPASSSAGGDQVPATAPAASQSRAGIMAILLLRFIDAFEKPRLGQLPVALHGADGKL